MNNTLSRRAFLGAGTALVAAPMLSACSSTTTGNVTTVTLNVAKVDAIFQAAQNFLPILLGDAAATGLLGVATVAAIELATKGIGTALKAFDTASGGAASVSYDSTSVKSAFSTALADAETILTDVQSVAAAKLGATTQVALQALETVVSSAQLMIALVSTRKVMAVQRVPLPIALLQLGVVAPAGVQ